jgi:ABC-type multidrug transport system fused ATPase/permease subunit
MNWIEFGKAVLYLLGERKRTYLTFSFILFLILGFGALPPYIIGKTVDFLSTYKAGESIQPFYILVIAGSILTSFAAFIRLQLKQSMGDVQSDISYDVRVKGFERLMDLSLAWHDKELTGNKYQRLQKGIGDLWTISYFFSNTIYPTIIGLVYTTVLLVFIRPFYISLYFLYNIGFFLILRYFYNRIQYLNEELNKAMENASGANVEGIGNILTIKSTGAQKKFGEHIAKQEHIKKEFEYSIRRVSIQQWQVYQVYNAFVMGIFLLLSGLDVVNGLLTAGSIVIINSYLVQMTNRTSEILSNYEKILEAKSGIGRMMSIFWAQDTKKTGTENFPADWKNISLEKANFVYAHVKNNTNTALTNIDLSINRYQKIGIVGKTGSGKSTLSKILVGLYPLTSGTYKIGSRNFSDISHEELSKHIAIVLQDSEMFNMTLEENITLLRKVDKELLEKAIKVAQLEEVVKKLPQGLITPIGEKGYHLSGGERQRVGIARAICRDPEIIIFDEATSSLDSRTEEKIQKALEQELTKKTLIFIAHRVSTLKNVETIYVFKEGSIIEKGTYEDLIKRTDSVFSQLYNLQVDKRRPS